MRRSEEIVSRYKELSKNEHEDSFGIQRTNLLKFLPFSTIKTYLRPDFPEEARDMWDWKPVTEETVKQIIFDYMPFAWKKANQRRSVPAIRSLEHMKIWLWLLEDTLADQLEYYQFYGKDKLEMICNKFNWCWEKWDNGERFN